MSARQFKSFAVRSVVATVMLILLVGLMGYGLHVYLGDLVPAIYTDVVTTVVLIATTIVLVYAVGHVLSRLEYRESLTPHQSEVLYRFVQLSTFGGVFLILTLYVWRITVTDVLLGAGVISVVLGLAARKTLGSVLAGVIIMSTDVFRVGDWVKVGEKYGRIERISFFNTEVLSPHGEKHVFPNDDLTTRDITNLGKDRYRNDVLVGVDYDVEPDAVITACDDVLQELTEDDTNHVDGFNPTTIKDFDDSQITLAVKMWVHEPTPQAINDAQTTVLSEIHSRFGEEGFEFPFPQRTVTEREA